ncbi:hypothetical protein NPIL_275961 [Nephila pilipes]|uniref:Uncharacterized protein n=1 Tax=Nephila pilipes TaxID=299642 RepID=A0A8X6PDA7_NEPPI|nr:hypothetical protein NPIL_275961 [Nephila pilipes]
METNQKRSISFLILHSQEESLFQPRISLDSPKKSPIYHSQPKDNSPAQTLTSHLRIQQRGTPMSFLARQLRSNKGTPTSADERTKEEKKRM